VRRAIAAAIAAGAALGCAAPAHATLAYVKGALQGKPVVWVAADDGADARSLAVGGYYPKVSPDGTQVAYITGTRRAALKVKPVAGGQSRTLANNVWNYDAVQWSPDSTKLSVATGPELGPYTLKLIDLATGDPRRLNKGGIYGVSFAPSGEGLVWARSFTAGSLEANLYTTTLDGGRINRITGDGNAAAPVWGPEKIAFNRSRKAPRRGDYDKLDIYTINADGTGIKRLTKTNPPFLLAGLVPLGWSADGTRLAAQYTGQDTSEAWRVNGQTGTAADATGKFDGVVGWDLSLDGTALLATTGYFDNPAGDVVALAWSGGAETVLAHKATQPSWSR
jgi:Tol biopolymer transport system component